AFPCAALAAHRALRPFPTRRSSDLAWAAVTLPDLPQGECVVDDADVLSEDTTAYLEQLNGQLEASCSGAQIGVLTVQYTGSASTDRKSTRLNSSHVSISYAVFCLKK